MASSSFHPFRFDFLLILLIIVLSCPHCLSARNMPRDKPDVKSAAGNTGVRRQQQYDFSKFAGAGPGSQISGVSDLKRYLHRLGYLAPPLSGSNFNDDFDGLLESAVARYQRRLGLHATGRLDPDTVVSLMSPRCGVSDHDHDHETSSSAGIGHLHETGKYKLFEGKLKWNKTTLTYSLSPEHTIHSLGQDEIRAAFAKAFDTWARVIPVKFQETSNHSSADVRIGFFSGFHGDADPFDGTRGTLVGHSFPPPIGELHLDADDHWAVDDFGADDTDLDEMIMDLESVAVHEIGHVLGLAHSSLPESVMYPIIPAMTKKTDLAPDDVEGIQALYGPNPDFKQTPSLPQQMSSPSPSLPQQIISSSSLARVSSGSTMILVAAQLLAMTV